jgi:hypothetical protein
MVDARSQGFVRVVARVISAISFSHVFPSIIRWREVTHWSIYIQFLAAASGAAIRHNVEMNDFMMKTKHPSKRSVCWEGNGRTVWFYSSKVLADADVPIIATYICRTQHFL